MFMWHCYQNRTQEFTRAVNVPLADDDVVRVKVWGNDPASPALDLDSEEPDSGGSVVDFATGEAEVSVTIASGDTGDLVTAAAYSVELSIVDGNDGMIRHVERGVLFVHASPAGSVDGVEYSSSNSSLNSSSSSSDHSSSSSSSVAPAPPPGSSGVLGFAATSTATVSGTGAASIIGSGAGGLTIGAGRWAVGESIYIEADGLYTSRIFPTGTLTIDISIGAVSLTFPLSAVPPSQVDCEWSLRGKFTRKSTGGSGTITGSASFTMRMQNGEDAVYKSSLSSPQTLSTLVDAAVGVTFQFGTSGNSITSNDVSVSKKAPWE